jgi:hypothetical protein
VAIIQTRRLEMKEQNKAVYEAPELMELDKVENVTLGTLMGRVTDNCCCVKKLLGGFVA